MLLEEDSRVLLKSKVLREVFQEGLSLSPPSSVVLPFIKGKAQLGKSRHLQRLGWMHYGWCPARLPCPCSHPASSPANHFQSKKYQRNRINSSLLNSWRFQPF